MHPSAGTGKRPPLSPQEGWLSDGRQVLHFRPAATTNGDRRWRSPSAKLIPGQPPLLKCRKEMTREEAIKLWAEKRRAPLQRWCMPLCSTTNNSSS